MPALKTFVMIGYNGRTMIKRLGIAAAMLALAIGATLVACASADTAPAAGGNSNGSPELTVRESTSNTSFESVNDWDDSAERARAEREAQEAREAQWRAQFPTDDYSNTLLIGDSLMQNASTALTEAMPGVTVNADSGRMLERGGAVFENKSPDLGVLDHIRNDDGSYARYVIGTGNNEAGGMPIEAAQEIVDCLGPDKQIYFITMCSLLNSYGTEVTNASIDAMVEQYDNVHKIDWCGFLAGRETDYLMDGIHVYPDRLADYAAFIKEGLDVVY